MMFMLMSAALAAIACSAAQSNRAQRIGGSLYECRGVGAEAAVAVDGLELHYDDSWNLYIRAGVYRDAPSTRSTEERADWGRVAGFVDECVTPRPSRLLRE